MDEVYIDEAVELRRLIDGRKAEQRLFQIRLTASTMNGELNKVLAEYYQVQLSRLAHYHKEQGRVDKDKLDREGLERLRVLVGGRAKVGDSK